MFMRISDVQVTQLSHRYIFATQDLRAAQDPNSIPMPSWLSSWQPEEAPPDENCWNHLEGTWATV